LDHAGALVEALGWLDQFLIEFSAAFTPALKLSLSAEPVSEAAVCAR
jgi:hypothetical protein